MKNFSMKNLIFTILGVILIGCGVAGLNLSNLGTDPYSCMNYGLSSILGLSFGDWQLILNIILFVPMLIIARNYIGFGSFANMIGVGYVAQFVCYIFSSMGIDSFTSIPTRLISMLLGLIILCFGAAMYTNANLGISPYDALAYILESFSNNKIKFKWFRIITDTICVSIGFITHSTIGLGTLFMMLCTGPLIQFFRDILKPLFVENPKRKVNVSIICQILKKYKKSLF